MIPSFGRKRIFAEFGATTFLKHCLGLAFLCFEKRLQLKPVTLRTCLNFYFSEE